MHKKQIQEEINHLMETLKDQYQSISKNNSDIPRIEIDLMKSTLRNLYDQLHRLERLQEQNIITEKQGTPEPEPVAALSEEVIVPVFTINRENIVEIQEINQETISWETISKPAEAESAPVENIFQPQMSESIKATKEEKPVIVLKQEEEKITRVEVSTAKTNRPKQTAGLFDEVTTIAETYTVKTTLHDRMSSGKADRSVADNLQSKPLSDLKKSIGINEKFVFVNELFEGNHQLFSQSIDQLNNFTAYEQARRHLFEELAGQLKWNMESRAFGDLSELVKRRFIS
ncbi:MAG: hypothetical protein ABI772_04590 [Bacteroidota bacterium]